MRRRSSPPKPPLPTDPGDLTWTPVVQGDVPQPSHWIRSDDLELFLRALAEHDGFTVAHHGRDVTNDDVADVLRLFGLKEDDVVRTFGRTGGQREYRVAKGIAPIGPIIYQCTLAASRIAKGKP